MEEECLFDHDLLIELSTNIKNIKKDINDIKYKLFGNGQEGIITTITKHKVYFALLGIALTIIGGGVINCMFN